MSVDMSKVEVGMKVKLRNGSVSEETKTADTPPLLREVPSAVIPIKQANLRDMYFCAALTGLCACPNAEVAKVGFVRAAFDIADEALKQRDSE